jgi:outer membrane protein assembly factor BamB
MTTYGAGFFFNPTVLQVEAVTNGSVLNPYSGKYLYITGTINNTGGYVQYYAWALLSRYNISAPNTWVDLAHVTFEVNPSLTADQIALIAGTPQQMIAFTTNKALPEELEFLDTNGNDITPYGHITNGTVTYTLPPSTLHPSPPTAASSESPASTVFLGTPQTFAALNTPAQYGWNGTQAVPITNYLWENVSNGYVYSTAQSFSVTFPTPGTYNIDLTVWASIADNAIYTYNESSTEIQTAIVVAKDWWTMFHHDLGHSGYSTSTAPTTNQTLWTYDTGAFLTCSSPAVAGGIVFIGSEYPGFSIYALEAATGVLIWNYTTSGAVDSSPAVANGVVFIGSMDNNVYALNATTGALVWKYTTGDEVESSPAVANGVVYIGSDDDNVYALNATTGALVWNYTTSGAVDSSSAVANGIVYVGSGDDSVYALNAAKGTLLWSYRTGGVVVSSPAVAAGVVYVSSMDDKVYALNAATGAMIWNYTTGAGVGSGVESSPAVANSVVYVGSDNDNIYALDAASGALIWNYTTGGSVTSSPAVAGGVVYVGSWNCKIYALNATTGAFVWSYKTGSVVASSPAVAGGVVYVGSLDEEVYAFGLSPLSTPIVRYVTFAESGLPLGTQWSVTFSGQTQSSTSNSIIFNAVNGVYTFSVTTHFGYVAWSSSGSIIVNGTNVAEQIIFIRLIPHRPWFLLYTGDGWCGTRFWHPAIPV